MKNKILVIILCLVFAFALISFAEAKRVNTDKGACNLTLIDSKITNGLTKLNANQKYLDFIAQSNYDAVRIIIDKQNYYFIYNNETWKAEQVSTAQQDFTVKLSCNNVKKIMDAYNSNNPKFMSMAASKLPVRVRMHLFNQCMKTPWCKEQVFGK
jgi:hypothetical protein